MQDIRRIKLWNKLGEGMLELLGFEIIRHDTCKVGAFACVVNTSSVVISVLVFERFLCGIASFHSVQVLF